MDATKTPALTPDRTPAPCDAPTSWWFVAWAHALAWLAWLLCGALFLVVVSGCAADPARGVPEVLTVTRTEFPPPTTVPSVTPEALEAAKSAEHASDQAQRLYPTLAALVPGNVEARRPEVLASYQDLLAGLRGVVGWTGRAYVKSQGNDAATATLVAELQGARRLVGVREAQLEAAERRHVQRLRETSEAHAAAVGALQARIDDLSLQREESRLATLYWLCRMAIVFGGLGVLASGLLLWVLPSSARRVGLLVCGLSLACISLGSAGLVYGREIAIVGLVLGCVLFLLAVWAGVHYLRLDNDKRVTEYKRAAIEIADGISQAFNAFPDLKRQLAPFLDQAQGPLARQIVDEATKSPGELLDSRMGTGGAPAFEPI